MDTTSVLVRIAYVCDNGSRNIMIPQRYETYEKNTCILTLVQVYYVITIG